MSAQDDLFKSLAGQAFKHAIDSNDGKNKSAETRLSLVLAGLLAFVGAEVVKITFRKNFGMSIVATVRLLICFIIFCIISYFAFYVSFTGENESEIGSTDSSFVFGVLYLFLAIYVLIKGMRQRTKTANNILHEESYGQSSLLAFLIKGGWSERQIYLFAEPITTLALGIFITSFNLLGGLPVVICAVSVWIHTIVMLVFSGMNSSQQNVVQLNASANQRDSFNEIKTNF